MATETVREAVGVFHDEKALRAAADELMISGFDRSCLSILAGQRAIEKNLDNAYWRIAELEDDPGVPRIAYMGTDSRAEAQGVIPGVLAYVGAVAAAGGIVFSGATIAVELIAVAAGGAGGLVGIALSRLIGRHHARYLQNHLEHGGILLWVRTTDEERERRAVEVLSRHSAENVHVHDLPKVDWTALKGGVSYDLSFMNRLGL